MSRIKQTSTVKNPEQTTAYNHKMIKTEEMNFTSKLSEKEMQDYNSPVHNTLHQKDSGSHQIRSVVFLSRPPIF